MITISDVKNFNSNDLYYLSMLGDYITRLNKVFDIDPTNTSNTIIANEMSMVILVKAFEKITDNIMQMYQSYIGNKDEKDFIEAHQLLKASLKSFYENLESKKAFK